MSRRSLRQRDQAWVAILGTLTILAALTLSLTYKKLPFVDRHTGYTAEFSYAGGLKSGDDVRVAGVSVGSVDSVSVDGAHVDVHFSVDPGLALGSRSSASVEVATVLGNVYLAVESAGTGRLRPGTPIPVSRTTTPYTILDALGGLAKISKKTDLGSLTASLQSISAALGAVAKPDIDATLTGLTKVSNALASRSGQIQQLIAGTQQVASTLQSKSSAIVSLLIDSNTFLRTLNERHTVVQSLFRNAAALSSQISTLIRQNNAPLTRALTSIKTISAVLKKDDTQLRRSITLLGHFSTNFANATGNGPWLDLLLPTGLIPDNVIAACGTKPVPGCGG